MILIFSIDNDPSTTEVIRWLNSLGRRDVVRINSRAGSDSAVRLYIDQSIIKVDAPTYSFTLNDVEAVWYRKGSFWFDGLFPDPDIPGHPALTANLATKVRLEDKKIREYFHRHLGRRARVLGNPDRSDLNKLSTLDLAQECGLQVPPFFVSNEPHVFIERLNRGESLITKPVGDGVYLWDLKECQRGYFSYTEELSIASLAGDERTLPPSFAQTHVRKSIELRVFYLDGRMWATAIFSQNDKKTRTDYRKYNFEKPNRNVPYTLPAEVARSLDLLFRCLELNTGSADFIVDHQGNHYFLEINPTGQFSGISNVCNFDLEYEIAIWLGGHDVKRSNVDGN